MSPTNSGWIHDGSPFKVYNAPIHGTVPIYSYHCVQSDGWRFMLSYGNSPASTGWTKDGVAFYAYGGVVE
jgi:hypothetical protein